MFDKYLPIVKPTEAVIMMIIFRQTIGWIDIKTKKRKLKDWITNSQFQKKSGLTDKTISQAIQGLVDRRLITVTDSQGNELPTPESRRRKGKLFYGPRFKRVG